MRVGGERKEIGEGDEEVQTSSCKINVMGMKCTVWGNTVNNYVISLYGNRP